jgi:hypothetical protein
MLVRSPASPARSALTLDERGQRRLFRDRSCRHGHRRFAAESLQNSGPARTGRRTATRSSAARRESPVRSHNRIGWRERGCVEWSESPRLRFHNRLPISRKRCGLHGAASSGNTSNLGGTVRQPARLPASSHSRPCWRIRSRRRATRRAASGSAGGGSCASSRRSAGESRRSMGGTSTGRRLRTQMASGTKPWESALLIAQRVDRIQPAGLDCWKPNCQ